MPYNLNRFADCVFETTDAFNILASEIPQEYSHANQLRVFDPSGRIIRTWDLGSESGAILWQINGEAPKGIYLASLVAGGKAPVTIRFSIVE